MTPMMQYRQPPPPYAEPPPEYQELASYTGNAQPYEGCQETVSNLFGPQHRISEATEEGDYLLVSEAKDVTTEEGDETDETDNP